MTVVFRSLRFKDCDERSLVLTAMGIEHSVERIWWSWCVLVPDDEAQTATEQLELYERENRVLARARKVSPVRSGAKLGVLVWSAVLLSVYVLQSRHGFGFDWGSVGRVDSAAVRAGEWWRVVTALTLHADIGHLIGNLVFGGFFGALLARQVGGGIAWFAILVSGTAGNALNVALQREHFAIGASTAVFGALGLLAAWLWLAGPLTQDNWGRRWAPVVGGLWLLTWLGTGDANTDIVAHLTGFVAGFALGALLTRLPAATEPHPALQWLTGLTALATVVGAWAWALVR